ncbi:MAG: pYEATS domain-containing protein [Candidatus Hodarchaeales archaeon]|jgi:transcription initiation factor IIF auxiliary subunit
MKVVTNYEKLRDDWYAWSVEIEGTDEELDEIDHVTYLLHPTFPNNRLVSSDKEEKFVIYAQGWGEFLIQAELVMKDKREKNAKKWLDLGSDQTKEQKEKFNGTIE